MGRKTDRSNLDGTHRPSPIDLEGSVSTYEKGSVNISSRFGVGHAGKLRAFDDLKRNEVNLFCTDWAPTKLPMWGHIAQMCLDVRLTKKDCGFFKPGRAAYKQLPMMPGHADLATVAIRDPATSRLMAFRPNALLFGDTSDVLR